MSYNRLFIFINCLLILGPFGISANENGAKTVENIQAADQAAWKEELFRELLPRVKQAGLAEHTLRLVLNNLDEKPPLDNREQELNRVLGLVRKCDIELRRGETYGSVVFQLKQEIAFSKREGNGNNPAEIVKKQNKFKGEKIGKIKGARELKSKLKEKKEKKEKIKKKK